MSIIGDGIMLGAGGETASIFVTGLSETDTVTASKDGKSIAGKWVTKITKSYQSLIPVMTSNTTPSGVASSFTSTSNNPAYKAFDGDETQEYASSYPYQAGADYVQYQFENAVDISEVRLMAYNDRSFTFRISTSLDGSKWEDIHSFTQETALGSGIMWLTPYILSEPVKAKYIRCTFDYWTDKTGNPACLREMQAYGQVDIEVSGFLISDVDKYGTWTVMATDGVQTATKNILVDSAIEYDVSISYVDKRLQIWLNGSGYTDESLVGNAVTNYGTSLVTSGDFPYYAFDGSSHYIQFPSQTIAPNDFAISLWGYFDGNYSWERFFDFGEGAAKDLWCGHSSTTGNLAFEHQVNSTGYTSNRVSFSSGAWHHIALRGNNGTTTMYVDGASVTSVSNPSVDTLSLANCYLGKSNWNDPYLHGRIADFRLYNTAITEAEIIELYQSGAYVPN